MIVAFVVIFICISICVLSIMGLYPCYYLHLFVDKCFITLLHRMNVNLKGKRESNLIENQLGGQDYANRYELFVTDIVSRPSL